ncbi:MAG: pyrimidine dimer DNA glycosylase/endonuclease V [Elusimicrobia bacterium]|nr:pyrimidine dimer DNA glycosylase/endonuclease V [Elusimicrobiota bacterium]
MRLWSLHPSHLDSRGLVALWREALLAQKVLRGLTRGYRHHPQLARFRARTKPVAAIASYLAAVADEAVRRGYRFDARKIAAGRMRGKIAVTRGQLAYERRHLLRKLKVRSPKEYAAQRSAKFKVHPLFRAVAGGAADWERDRR